MGPLQDRVFEFPFISPPVLWRQIFPQGCGFLVGTLLLLQVNIVATPHPSLELSAGCAPLFPLSYAANSIQFNLDSSWLSYSNVVTELPSYYTSTWALCQNAEYLSSLTPPPNALSLPQGCGCQVGFASVQFNIVPPPISQFQPQFTPFFHNNPFSFNPPFFVCILSRRHPPFFLLVHFLDNHVTTSLLWLCFLTTQAWYKSKIIS